MSDEKDRVPLAADDSVKSGPFLAPHLLADPGSGHEPPTQMVSQDR
jgi:hypothetical protein